MRVNTRSDLTATPIYEWAPGFDYFTVKADDYEDFVQYEVPAKRVLANKIPLTAAGFGHLAILIRTFEFMGCDAVYLGFSAEHVAIIATKPQPVG